MDIDSLRKLCLSLPGTTEDIKWGNDLCFLVAGKMFCVTGLDHPQKISFKVPDEIFEELSNTDGFIPAPYMARAKWVLVQDISIVTKKNGKNIYCSHMSLLKRNYLKAS